jgi:hypothetical protein
MTPNTESEWRDRIGDSLKYWEPRRIAYNAALAGVAAAVFFNSPGSVKAVGWRTGQMLFNLAIVANVLYCAAYVADQFVLLSAFRDVWRRRRWVLFAAGTLFAASLAMLFSESLVESAAAR